MHFARAAGVTAYLGKDRPARVGPEPRRTFLNTPIQPRGGVKAFVNRFEEPAPPIGVAHRSASLGRCTRPPLGTFPPTVPPTSPLVTVAPASMVPLSDTVCGAVGADTVNAPV